MLTAHPDDESFAAAGTIHKNHEVGGQTVLVCATLGERGVSHMQNPMSIKEVKMTRKRELEKCAEILGISKVLFLNLPDTKLSAKGKVLQESCLKIARAVSPELIMSFGDDGLTGHKDHVAIGRAAKHLAKDLRLDLCMFAFPKSFAKVAKALFVERRKFGNYLANRGWKFEKPNIDIHINPAVKGRALECHASQLDRGGVMGSFPEKYKKLFLSREYFKYVEYHRS